MVIKENKSVLAIVVVCYNRPDSTLRLLNSLESASYPEEKQIPLIISVDCSGNERMYQVAREFKWSHGPMYPIIREERLGLKRHIYKCGDLSKYFKGVIILEDDLFVAPDFYHYSDAAVTAYYDEEKVAGIALYSDTMYGYVGLPLYYWYDGSDGFMMQSTITSGECFSDKMWERFRKWYDENEDVDPAPIPMPHAIKNYRRAWSKYFNIYLVQKDLYFVHPHFSTTTNFGEAGEHGDGNNMIHSRMILGHKDYQFRPFPESVKYDIYGDRMELGEYLGISDEDLCVDFYGDKDNEQNKRYWLSPYQFPYKKLSSFALTMEPMEANIIFDVSGNDLFLYDTAQHTSGKVKIKLTQHQLSYHFRNVHWKLLRRYYHLVLKDMFRIKLKRFFKR